jgi:hypothetical protein
MKISRFPCKRRLRMPGSPTTRGRRMSCVIVTRRVAFCGTENIGTPNLSYAAQYLACAFPCERFTPTLTSSPCITRGRCGSLSLHRSGLAPPTFRQSPGAPVHSIKSGSDLNRDHDAMGRFRTSTAVQESIDSRAEFLPPLKFAFSRRAANRHFTRSHVGASLLPGARYVADRSNRAHLADRRRVAFQTLEANRGLRSSVEPIETKGGPWAQVDRAGVRCRRGRHILWDRRPQLWNI